MLKLPIKSPIVNGNIDLSEYAKKSDVDVISTSLGNKVDKKEVEKLSSQLDTLTKNVDDKIKEIQSTTDTFKENINTSFNELSNEQQNNFEALREEVLSDIEASYVGYDNEQHHNLESRLNSDFDKINQRVNDSSYLAYEGTSIKADNTYLGLTKDTVIKGRALQNLRGEFITCDKGATYNSQTGVGLLSGQQSIINFKKSLIKANTKYTIFMNITKNTLEVIGSTTPPLKISVVSETGAHGTGYYNVSKEKGMCRFLLKGAETLDGRNILITIRRLELSGEFEFKDFMILEGDHTQTPLEELPFIEGIESVGESELTDDGYKISGKSCGKNLFDGKTRNGYYSNGEFKVNSSNLANVNPIEIKPNTYYTGSGDSLPRMSFYDKDMNFISYNSNSSTCLSPSNAKYINIHGMGATYFQIEESTSSTPYEPYQESNYSYILNEPLRSLPNGVCDTIDLETGVLTRRVGKIEIDENLQAESFGTDWTMDETKFYFIAKKVKGLENLKKVINYNNHICDKVRILNPYQNNTNSTALIYNLEKSEFRLSLSGTEEGINDYINWLKENPLTFYFELAEPTTEQLTPCQLKSFDTTTHIISDNKLMPIVSTKIPSNVQAIISTLKLENSDLKNNVEVLTVENEELKSVNNVQDEMIDINMLASDELYTLIEPLLVDMLSERGISKLVDMYVAMVQRGLKIIDQVPARYRAEVQAILEALEK